METGLQLMKFQDKIELEIVEIDGEILFNAHQIGEGLALGFKGTQSALARMKPNHKVLVTNELISRSSAPSNRGCRIFNNAGENFLKESGVYDFIFASRKPEAEAFKDWITEEVLPSIRKTGLYAKKYTLSESLQMAADQARLAEAREKQLQLQAPKVAFYDAIAGSKDAIHIGDLAKVLNYPGMGPINMFRFLRANKILMDGNMPYQEYIDRGHFQVIEQSYTDPHGERHIVFTTLVLPKGQDAVLRLMKSKLGDNPKAKGYGPNGD